jgi:hypothetical protein
MPSNYFILLCCLCATTCRLPKIDAAYLDDQHSSEEVTEKLEVQCDEPEHLVEGSDTGGDFEDDSAEESGNREQVIETVEIRERKRKTLSRPAGDEEEIVDERENEGAQKLEVNVGGKIKRRKNIFLDVAEKIVGAIVG